MTLRQLHFVPPVLLLVAGAHDLLSDSGLVLDARRTTSSREQVEALVAGTTDIAVTAMDNAFVWNASGADVRIVGQIERSTLLSLYATAGRRSLADLEGVRFAVDALSNGFAIVARWMLARAGVTADFVEIGGVKERLDAVLDGRADATLLGPPLDAMADAAGLTRIVSIDSVLPDYPGQGILVRARRTAEEDDELRRYLGILTRAAAIADTMDPSAGAELLIRSGIPDASAGALWAMRPSSLSVQRDGLAVLASLRSELGSLPADYAGPEDLVDDAYAVSGFATPRRIGEAP